MPSVFVLQINGQQILVFEAVSTSEARQLAKEEWFCNDLLELRSDGRPVWDGQAHLEIRPIVGEQVEAVRQLLKKTPQDEDVPIVYLIKVDK